LNRVIFLKLLLIRGKQTMAMDQPIWTPPADQLGYFNQLFALGDPTRVGVLNGGAAVLFLRRSRLPDDLLRTIWELSDSHKQGYLRLPDFYIAMRLVSLAQSGHPVSSHSLMATRLTPLPPPQMVLADLQQQQMQQQMQQPLQQPPDHFQFQSTQVPPTLAPGSTSHPNTAPQDDEFGGFAEAPTGFPSSSSVTVAAVAAPEDDTAFGDFATPAPEPYIPSGTTLSDPSPSPHALLTAGEDDLMGDLMGSGFIAGAEDEGGTRASSDVGEGAWGDLASSEAEAAPEAAVPVSTPKKREEEEDLVSKLMNENLVGVGTGKNVPESPSLLTLQQAGKSSAEGSFDDWEPMAQAPMMASATAGDKMSAIDALAELDLAAAEEEWEEFTDETSEPPAPVTEPAADLFGDFEDGKAAADVPASAAADAIDVGGDGMVSGPESANDDDWGDDFVSADQTTTAMMTGDLFEASPEPAAIGGDGIGDVSFCGPFTSAAASEPFVLPTPEDVSHDVFGVVEQSGTPVTEVVDDAFGDFEAHDDDVADAAPQESPVKFSTVAEDGQAAAAVGGSTFAASFDAIPFPMSLATEREEPDDPLGSVVDDSSALSHLNVGQVTEEEAAGNHDWGDFGDAPAVVGGSAPAATAPAAAGAAAGIDASTEGGTEESAAKFSPFLPVDSSFAASVAATTAPPEDLSTDAFQLSDTFPEILPVKADTGLGGEKKEEEEEDRLGDWGEAASIAPPADAPPAVGVDMATVNQQEAPPTADPFASLEATTTPAAAGGGEEAANEPTLQFRRDGERRRNGGLVITVFLVPYGDNVLNLVFFFCV
jgi:hypothetical protein